MHRKRSIIVSLLVSLTVLISAYSSFQPKAQLLNFKTLHHFPSASAIEYDNGCLYIFGDDAPHVLILDTNYRPIDSLRYSPDTDYRMKKSEKMDFESATVIHHNQTRHLYALSSFSTKSRSFLFHLPLNGSRKYSITDLSDFADKLKSIPDLNIEGMAMVHDKLILANRANKKHPHNKLIIGSMDIENANSFSPEMIIQFDLNSSRTLGLSGLYYITNKDLLLFTASEEETGSASEDGAISDSYLGWIKDFSGKMKNHSITPTRMIRLSSIDNNFSKQKVESVCLEEINGGQMILHLVSDNDDGKSRLFKLKLNL